MSRLSILRLRGAPPVTVSARRPHPLADAADETDEHAGTTFPFQIAQDSG